MCGFIFGFDKKFLVKAPDRIYLTKIESTVDEKLNL